MYYRICDNIALRSWMFVPAAYYRKGELPAHPLTDGELDVLLLCDGEHNLPDISDLGESPGTSDELIQTLRRLTSEQLVEPCEKGSHPSEWSAYRAIPHRHFPKMNFMLTGRCNYNCIHCFNAADLAPLSSEWSYEDALALLDQAAEAGIHALTITGGEPMLHPHFMELMHAVYDRGMYVEELNTNGYFITADILDEFQSFGCKPLIKISFDGIGCHDWIRNREGAEGETLAAIDLCVKKGFRVMIQMQVNQRNEASLLPTAKLLNEMGVEELRLIRTTEVARWREYAGDACISLEDYYTRMPLLARKLCDYMREIPVVERRLKKLIIWQLLTVLFDEGSYYIDTVRLPQGEYRDTYAVCKGNRGMIGVSSNGDMVPCLQMSGYFYEHGIRLGNLHEKPLGELLSGGDYLSVITKNLYQLRQLCTKCDTCPLYEYCGGGCRALALLYSQGERDMWSEDSTKCAFYEGGYYQYTVESMGDMTNMTVVPGDALMLFEASRHKDI